MSGGRGARPPALGAVSGRAKEGAAITGWYRGVFPSRSCMQLRDFFYSFSSKGCERHGISDQSNARDGGGPEQPGRHPSRGGSRPAGSGRGHLPDPAHPGAAAPVCVYRAGGPGRGHRGVHRHRHRRAAGRVPGPRRGGAVRGENHGAHPARRAPAGAPGQEEAGPEPGHGAVPAAGGAPRPQGAGGVPHPGRRLPGLPGVPGRGGLYRDPHPQDRPRRGGGGRQHLPPGLLWQKGLPGPVPPVLQADHGGGVRAGVRGGPGVPGGEARHPAASQRVHLPGL